MPQPLDAIRIIDLSRLLPGPMCSWYLRGLGAEVVKVEDPGAGDYLRAIPPYGADGMGAWFSAINAGCRSVVLDLKSDAGRSALRALLETADVLIEGFRPGVMARLGLDPVGLQERHPRLVIASISGFGQAGPLRDAAGHDMGYMGFSGGMALGARHDGVPDVPGIQVADIAGGALTAALRITAALLLRERTGRGGWLDVSMTEAALPLALPALTQAATTGDNPTPGREPLTGGMAAYRCYRARDGGLLSVAAVEHKFQLRIAQGLGLEMPLDDSALAARIGELDRDAVLAAVGDACVSPILDPLDVLSHPLHRDRRAIRGEGAQARVAPPLGGEADWLHAPAPKQGEHTDEVLADAGWSR